MKVQAQTTFAFCIKRAVSFYESAFFLHENTSAHIIAFYLHQTVEQTYAALFKSLRVYYEKTHAIRSLKDFACRCAPQLNDIFPDDTEMEKHLLNVLEDAYLNARYDNQYTIDDNDLTILFGRVKRVLVVAQQVVKQVLDEIPVGNE